MGNPYAPPGSPDRPGHGTGGGAGGGPAGSPPEARRGRDDAFGRPTRPAGRPPSPAQARRVGVLVGRFALLVLASLLTARLALPWSVAAPVFGALGLVAGVAALRAAVRAGTSGTLTASLGVSLGMTGLILLQQVVLLALWPVTSDLQRCRDRAVTVTAERACQDDYERRIRDLSRLPTG